ncbi:MAG: hypothetical protein JWN70_3385 [Planctomycetaceae bacterium]|nr:hypothetical protein [Planctomycetaceae bacterium]
MQYDDAKYTEQFDNASEMNDAEMKWHIAAAPNLRAHVERFIQTLQFECLDTFVVVSRGHLNLINREFQRWHND